MTNSHAYETMLAVIGEIFAERGQQAPSLDPSAGILETGLDSLDIAGLVARLDERLGFDPFASGEVTEFPRTLEAFAALYPAADGNHHRAASQAGDGSL